jgi:mycoredoxin
MLKKALINLVAFALFLGAGLWLGPHLRSTFEHLFPEPAYVNGDYDALYRQAAKPVVMFSTSTCPHCQHAREFLREARVDYQDLVIDQSPDAKQQFTTLGGSGVPLLFIGSRRIVGFREDTIRESLALIHR